MSTILYAQANANIDAANQWKNGGGVVVPWAGDGNMAGYVLEANAYTVAINVDFVADLLTNSLNGGFTISANKTAQAAVQDYYGNGCVIIDADCTVVLGDIIGDQGGGLGVYITQADAVVDLTCGTLALSATGWCVLAETASAVTVRCGTITVTVASNYAIQGATALYSGNLTCSATNSYAFYNDGTSTVTHIETGTITVSSSGIGGYAPTVSAGFAAVTGNLTASGTGTCLSVPTSGAGATFSVGILTVNATGARCLAMKSGTVTFGGLAGSAPIGSTGMRHITVASGGTPTLVAKTPCTLWGVTFRQTSDYTDPGAANVATGNNYTYAGSSQTASYPTTATTQAADAETLTGTTLDADGTDTTVAFGASDGTAQSGAVYTAGQSAGYASAVSDCNLPYPGEVTNGVTNYGFPSDPKSGARTDAETADVQSGVKYGDPGGQLTGTFVVPAEADVKEGTEYGDLAEFTGSYDPMAAAVFPAEANVEIAETAYGPTGDEYAGLLDLAAEQAAAAAAQYAIDQADATEKSDNIDGGVFVVGVEGKGVNATTLLTALGMASGDLDAQLAAISSAIPSPSSIASQVGLELADDFAAIETLDADGIRDAIGLAAADLDDQLAAITAKTALITAGKVSVRSPVSADGGELELIREEEYTVAAGQAIEWTDPGTWPDLDGLTLRLTVRRHEDDAVELEINGTLAAVSPAQVIRYEPASTLTELMTPSPGAAWNCRFDACVQLASGGWRTLKNGRARIVNDCTRD